MLTLLTKPLSEYKVLGEQEAKTKLGKLSEELVKKLSQLQHQEKYDQIVLLGVGNSIAAGWSATNNNVNPLVNKLDEFILPYAKQYDIDIAIHSYTLASHNTNDKIYKLLLQDPSLDTIRERFEQSFDEWKEIFANTAFENYVDKEEAMKFYLEGTQKFSDNFGENLLTLTFFNGCSGLVLEKLNLIIQQPNLQSIKTIITKNGRSKLYKEEVKYLTLIRDYILSQSTHSYLTIGNFPYINTMSGLIVNPIIDEFNHHISSVANHERTDFYDGMSLSFFQDYNEKIKVDNHPTVSEQYSSLIGYVNHLIDKIDKPKVYKK